MVFTVRGDFRKLEIATEAAIERRRVGLAHGSLVTVKEVDAMPLEVAGIASPESDDVEKRGQSSPRVEPARSESVLVDSPQVEVVKMEPPRVESAREESAQPSESGKVESAPQEPVDSLPREASV
jgi:hypothetical protein